MTRAELDKVSKVHFIGIGGIGMSALARMMLLDRKKVTGSDSSLSSITEELGKLGATIFTTQEAKNIGDDVDLVVYTIAVPESNPELAEARRRKITTLTYPEFLGFVSRDYYSIAVSGTHGKTTTTAMIAHMLRETGKEPTAVIGSLLKTGEGEERSNFIAGKGKYFVVEACEYKRSFLNLHPTILVITNIDNDHLDYYKDVADIQSAFNELARKVPADGFIVTNAKDWAIKPALEGVTATIVDYTKYVQMPPLPLKVPGLHNQLNAGAALAVADILKIGKVDAVSALTTFPGTWRRFEYKGESESGAIIYDDYGHHPTEIKVTLRAAREKFPDVRMVVAFQPHLYSRTKLLLDGFAEAFVDADEVILAPIYAAREPNDVSISSDILASKINLVKQKATSLPTFEAIEEYLKGTLQKGDLFITMGAGDINKVSEFLVVH